MNNSSYPMVNQSEHKRRSLFNLEGAIERLCTFKCGKREDFYSDALFIRGCSSAGRAPALQAGGQEFDPPHLHHRASEDEGTTTVAKN